MFVLKRQTDREKGRGRKETEKKREREREGGGGGGERQTETYTKKMGCPGRIECERIRGEQVCFTLSVV